MRQVACMALTLLSCIAVGAGTRAEQTATISEVESVEVTMVPTAEPEAAIPSSLVCRGYQPTLWSLQVDGSTASLDRLGNAPETLMGVRADASGTQPPFTVWRGRQHQAAADLVTLIIREDCLDSFGDTPRPMRAIVSRAGGETLTGCCRAGTVATEPARPAPAEGRRAGWWETVPGVLAAVDLCLAMTAGKARAVSGIQHNTEGQITIRMNGAENRRFRCRLGADLKVLDLTASSAAEIWQAGERRVLFTRAPAEPPTGGCFVHERVVGKGGILLGWLSRDTC